MSRELTAREVQVLEQAVLGHTARQTADTLGLSFYTIQAYRRQVIAKLQANNMVEAVATYERNQRKLR